MNQPDALHPRCRMSVVWHELHVRHSCQADCVKASRRIMVIAAFIETVQLLYYTNHGMTVSGHTPCCESDATVY